MLNNRIKTIIFDFGGVLLNLDKVACVKAFNELGCPQVEYYLDNCRQNGFFLDFEEGKISNEEFFAQLQQLADPNISTEQIKSAYLQFLTDLPEYKLNLILDLHKKYKVLLLSNINSFVYNHCKKKYFETGDKKLSDFFDEVYLSFELGVCKPDRKIFEFMIEDAKLNPQECFYLDDGTENIKMGKSLGFECYQPKINEDFRFLFE